MAMSHEACDHPRTPSARTKCRKAGGPKANGEMIGNTFVEGPRLTEAKRRVRPIHSTNKPGVEITTRNITTVPIPFRHIIMYAWERDLAPCFGHPFNDREARIVITSPSGELTLVWAHGQPHGIHGAFWRPVRSSVTRTMPTVDEGLKMLKGGS